MDVTVVIVVRTTEDVMDDCFQGRGAVLAHRGIDGSEAWKCCLRWTWPVMSLKSRTALDLERDAVCARKLDGERCR